MKHIERERNPKPHNLSGDQPVKALSPTTLIYDTILHLVVVSNTTTGFERAQQTWTTPEAGEEAVQEACRKTDQKRGQQRTFQPRGLSSRACAPASPWLSET
jgi:hypothetical protein